jgi:hypothetical protein
MPIDELTLSVEVHPALHVEFSTFLLIMLMEHISDTRIQRMNTRLSGCQQIVLLVEFCCHRRLT